MVGQGHGHGGQTRLLRPQTSPRHGGQTRPLRPGAVLQHGAGADLAGAGQQTQGHPNRAPETSQGRVLDSQPEVPAIQVHEAGPLRPS